MKKLAEAGEQLRYLSYNFGKQESTSFSHFDASVAKLIEFLSN
jgi:hypothetical protein